MNNTIIFIRIYSQQKRQRPQTFKYKQIVGFNSITRKYISSIFPLRLELIFSSLCPFEFKSVELCRIIFAAIVVTRLKSTPTESSWNSEAFLLRTIMHTLWRSVPRVEILESKNLPATVPQTGKVGGVFIINITYA